MRHLRFDGSVPSDDVLEKRFEKNMLKVYRAKAQKKNKKKPETFSCSLRRNARRHLGKSPKPLNAKTNLCEVTAPRVIANHSRERLIKMLK